MLHMLQDPWYVVKFGYVPFKENVSEYEES